MIATKIKAELGAGIYTIPEVSSILKLPSRKVRSALKLFWNKRFASVDGSYSWGESHQAINFYTMIEFYVFFKLKEKKVHYTKIIEAHKNIGEFLNTDYPFAHASLLTDGKQIFMDHSEFMMTADGRNQTVIGDIISLFCDKIDFGNSKLPEKYWPNGKDNSVVVDPERQFGLPSIDGTNIRVQTIYNFHLAGEKIDKIAKIYQVSIDDVQAAIQYCEAA